MRNGKPNPKNYPYWVKVISLLTEKGHRVSQVGVAGEQKLCETFHKGLSTANLKDLLKESDLFISVDNFFPHFAHFHKKYGIVLFSRSDPKIYGYPENINLLKDRKYLRPDQFGLWESCDVDEDSFISPEYVLKAIEKFK